MQQVGRGKKCEEAFRGAPVKKNLVWSHSMHNSLARFVAEIGEAVQRCY